MKNLSKIFEEVLKEAYDGSPLVKAVQLAMAYAREYGMNKQGACEKASEFLEENCGKKYHFTSEDILEGWDNFGNNIDQCHLSNLQNNLELYWCKKKYRLKRPWSDTDTGFKEFDFDTLEQAEHYKNECIKYMGVDSNDITITEV